MNNYTFPAGPGEHILEVTLPAAVKFTVAANSHQQFNIHVEKSGNKKLPPLAAALVDSKEEVIASTADGRTLGSNQPHFVTIGLPKTTPSKTDFEVPAGDYEYRLVSLGTGGVGTGDTKVSVGILRS